MTTKLAFTKDSPLNTALVDEATGTVVYEIETERSFLSKTKFMREPSHSAFPTLSFCSPSFGIKCVCVCVWWPWIPEFGLSDRTSTEAAKIKWQRLSSDTIVYRGQEMSRDEFLPIAGRFSR